MATYTKQLLSGSTNGKQIKVTGNSSPGITIHTATNVAGQFDEIWIWAYNDGPNTCGVTIQWGGTTTPDNNITVNVPAQSGRVLVCDGMLLNGGLLVKAYGSVSNQVMLDGYVNNIAP